MSDLKAERTKPTGETPAASAEAESTNILVGIAGWSYADWKGVFYPEPRPPRFSELRYAAERFDCIEINSTFYRIPALAMVKSWAERVRDLPGFLFTAKLVRNLTHADKLDLQEAKRTARAFREAVEPLLEAGRLGAVLVQFPWYFADGAEARARLEFIREALPDLPLVVELRHRSFLSSGPDGALPFLTRLGLNFANIDLPRSSTAPPPTCVSTGPIGYYRLHGRNRKTWFDRNAGRDEKYDYLYSRKELETMLPSIQRLSARTEKTFVIANNHYRGQAPANAFQLIDLLGRKPKDVPESLQLEFPFLKDIAPPEEKKR